MEFLKTCTTNAHAIADFEAIAYQAFSVARTPSNTSTGLHQGNPSEDARVVEAQLRRELLLVVHDATRPWLWLFQPTTVDKAGTGALPLPQVDAFHLQREQTGFIKSSELARPPTRASNPLNPTTSATSSSPTAIGLSGNLQSGAARPSQGNYPANATDQQPVPDYCMLYELFTSSVAALISFHLVRECNVIALNYRTFVSRTLPLYKADAAELSIQPDVHWLTSLHVHWTGSGTLLVLTYTEQTPMIRCLTDVTEAVDKMQLVGTCIRIAPNGLLARIASFEDPLTSISEEMAHRHKKRNKNSSLEQSIEKWKAAVTLWLAYRGYSLPNLELASSWIRIRTSLMSSSVVSSPAPLSLDRDILWPRALCFAYANEHHMTSTAGANSVSMPESSPNILNWFETADTAGYIDPFDVAHEWFLGKPNRDKVLDTKRKSQKSEGDTSRRKEEQASLFPSSPLNARSSAYGDLQAVSGVYPTPPDGVAPGTSHSDAPTVFGATPNVVLTSGGTGPAINLSGPPSITHVDGQLASTSPVFPTVSDTFNLSSGNDDLFEDIEEDGFGGDGVNDADFDFFDGPDDEDIDMADASTLAESKVTSIKDTQEQDSLISLVSQIREDTADPIAALENILDMTSKTIEMEVEAPISSKQPMPGVGTSSQDQIKLFSAHNDSPLHVKISPSGETTPPLSPTLIAKTLQRSALTESRHVSDHKGVTDHQRDSAFDPISFSRKMGISDAKYQDKRADAHLGGGNVNQIRPIFGPSQIKSLRDLPLLTKLRYTVSVASAHKIPEISSLAYAVSEDSDSESDLSDTSVKPSSVETSIDPSLFIGSIALPTKRKLPADDNETPKSVTSFAESFIGDRQEHHDLQFDETHLIYFEPNSWDWSLTSFPPIERSLNGARFSMPALLQSFAQMPDTPTSQSDPTKDLLDDKRINGKEGIAVTQIITEQIVSATLDILGEDSLRELRSSAWASAETRWHSLIKEVFPNAINCKLPVLVAVHDVFPEFVAQVKGQQRPPQRKPSESAAIPGNHMYQFNPPLIRVRRAETHWDLLPPAISFWEALGLSPVNQPKNIIALCIHPRSESIKPCLETFLLNLQLTYDSCKLGNHARAETLSEFEGGLVPFPTSSNATPREIFNSLREICIQVGKLLSFQHAKIREQQDSKIDAFVIYMVNPFNSVSALWELCSAFWALFQAYGQGPLGRPDQPHKPDLVLQIIPMQYIASFDSPVILDPGTYANLAREVYDRCPPSAPSGDKAPLSIYTAPAFQLEEALPRGVPFKLVSEPPPDLLRENGYMHLGYAVSLDGTWITAAWTDSCGKSQAVVSYHLGTRVFGEIAKEMWQTTIEILQSRRVHWRVCVAKAGVMDREEFETWAFLISCPTHLNLFITLLTVDTNPPYKFTPATSAPGNAASNAPGQPSVPSPDSTSQTGVSPDPTVNLTPAATPSADSNNIIDPSTDAEARLVDVTDETWGIILAHRLHNSNSTNQFSPALISGLLVKRGETLATSNMISQPSPDIEHGPIVVGINILWIGAVGSTRAATSPFPPSGSDGVSPGGANPNAYASANVPSVPNTSPDGATRSTNSLVWTPTVQMRTTAENLLKEMLVQFRALGSLAKLRGMKGTRHGTVPWHIAAAKRGAMGLGKVMDDQ